MLKFEALSNCIFHLTACDAILNIQEAELMNFVFTVNRARSAV